MTGAAKTIQDIQRAWDTQFSEVNRIVGADIYTKKNNDISFNADAFRGNALSALGAILEQGLISRLANWQEAVKAGATTNEQINAFATAQGLSQINELQSVTHDYIISLSDVVESMSDAKDSFKEFYDEVTGTTYYIDDDFSVSDRLKTTSFTVPNQQSLTDEEVEKIAKALE